MPISSHAVGTELPVSTLDITTREMLAYAAGIGDTGPASFQDDRAAGIVAPPPYCVSLEWPVVSNAIGRESLRASPDEVRRGVHASQDSHFHRPIRPGDRLTTRGRYVAIRDSRAGTVLTTRLETTDEQGDPVVTSWSQSIFRGVRLDGSDRSEALSPEVPDSALRDPKVSEIWIAREAPHVYTECARIWNPIHTEREVALAAGLPDIILHGTATWALAAREIVREYADGDGSRLVRFHGRFSAMVIPGCTIQVEHAEVAGDGETKRVAFRVLNEQNEVALRDGIAELELGA